VGTPVAWVSADEEDDVPRFLVALARALERFDLPWRVSPNALATLSEAPRGVRQVADELVNAFAESEIERGFIIIDDVHRFGDFRLFELFNVLIDRLPPNLALVMASRTEPPLQVARLRARDQLGEFKQPELGFDRAEVTALLIAQRVASDRAEELLKRTDGWPAGLRLMLTTGTRTPSSTSLSQRYVFDFLAAEVLAQMPSNMRKFLLRCSILSELSAARCAHVSGLADAQALFEQVQRDGLFVTPLDEAGGTLRLHDLFRDFLEERLQRDESAELPGLLRRAADGEPDLARAVGWLARAGDWERAAQELASRGPPLLAEGGAAAIERMLDLFPVGGIDSFPDLAFLRGVCAYQSLDFDGVVAHMQSAQDLYQRAGRLDMALMAKVFGHLAQTSNGMQAHSAQGVAELRAIDRTSNRPYPANSLVGTFVPLVWVWQAAADGNVDDMAPAFRTCIERMEQVPEYQAWDNFRMFTCMVGLPGMGQLFERFDRGAMSLTAHQASMLRVVVLHQRACRALAAGHVGEAFDWLCNADDDLRWLGSQRAMLTENLILHLLIDGARGDAASCASAADQLCSDLRQSPLSNQRSHGSSLLAAVGRAMWLVGDVEGVRRSAEQIAAGRNSFEWRWADDEDALLQGMVALLDGRDEQAERLLARSGPVEVGAWFASSSRLVLCAEAQRRQGKLDAACETLRPFINHAIGGGSIGGALTAGEAVLEQLARQRWKGRLRPAESDELQRWWQLARGQKPSRPAPDPGSRLPAGLTEREADVLALIAAGQSNKLIARTLDLSPFTVKRHVANILNKIGLASRTEAAQWWTAHKSHTAGNRSSPNHETKRHDVA
jgi:LuxR family maltose regulon positive regulatory protein